jgi:hypothetical protein
VANYLNSAIESSKGGKQAYKKGRQLHEYWHIARQAQNPNSTHAILKFNANQVLSIP